MAADAPAYYDSPWKEALALYFREFLQLLQPELHNQIDWSVAPTFLDRELQAISHDVANDRRLAGKLVLVRLRRIDAPERWLLIHIEVQGGHVTNRDLQDMARRMYRYSYRIGDRCLVDGSRLDDAIALALDHSSGGRDPARLKSATDSGQRLKGGPSASLTGLGILTARAKGPPVLTYTQGIGNCGVEFTCPVLYLGQWLDRLDELAASARSNPFAVIVMAQLLAQRTHGRGTDRLTSKIEVARLLYEYGYSLTETQKLLRLIDWMMRLPRALNALFIEAVSKIEQEKNMTYIPSYEREAMRKGKIEGRTEGESGLLLRLLVHRFGPVPKATQERIQSATSAQLETWSLNILDAETLDEVFLDGR